MNAMFDLTPISSGMGYVAVITLVVINYFSWSEILLFLEDLPFSSRYALG